MTIHDVAIRYSKALFRMTNKEDHTNVLNDLTLFMNVMMSSDKIHFFFDTPHISHDEKIRLIKSTYESAFSKELISFLCLLIKKERFSYLKDMINHYQQLINAENNLSKARLIVATPLDPETKQKLISKLESLTNQKVDLTEDINPKILGGGVLIFGNKMIDFSLHERLSRLKKELLSINI